MTIVDKIIKPENCFLGICLPVKKDDFISSLDPKCHKTYSKIREKKLGYNLETLWEEDHLPLVNLILEKKKELERLGVKVCLDFSLVDMDHVWSYDVITIFAHHDDKVRMIELFDKMYDVRDIISHVPLDKNKIIDLTMCRSIALQTAIKTHRPNCIVAANKMETNPEFRFLCYKKAIELLQSKDINYIDAIKEVRILLLHSIKKQ
jgi:hypothetical protein